jgi:hypothetical protein
MRTLVLFTAVTALFLAGCSSSSGGGSNAEFRRKADQVQAGTPKSEVLRALGKPDERRPGVAGVQRTGPQPPLTVNAGSRYEGWIYLRGDSEYHVFMGPSATNPGQWEVHSVSANPRGAVAH